MVDSGASFNKPGTINHSNKLPQLDGASAPNVNLSTINIDNIFQQSSLLLQKLSTPPQVEAPKEQPANFQNVNVQETQNLNNFLHSLGFKIGTAAPTQAKTQSTQELTPLQLVARAKDGVYLVSDQDKEYLQDKSKLICETATVTLFNRTGNLLAFASQQSVGVYNFTEKKARVLDLPNVLALDFSQGQRFLTAIDKRDNRFFLSIFEPDPLRKLYEYETVRYKKETWPQLKFTENDELAFWASKMTQIEVLNPRQNFQHVRTIETQQFDFFNISVKMDNLLVVCHGAGYNGHEGRINIYKYHDLDQDPTPFVSKVIDKAHEVNLFFSPSGQNLLLWAQTFTDKTGQSYYGEHMLLYLDMNKKILKRVPTYKGPIHDVAWNPNSLEFIVISGFMPAGSVLFDNLCTPKFEFGKHHKNCIKWSPLSRFVCLAGFGNLPGDMEIWDVYSLKQVGTCKSQAAVSCRWAPDGRRIVTGVLNPRLRVSNNYKIFKYNGELLNFVDFSQSELYEVAWRPGKFQDRPATPQKTADKGTDSDGAAKAEKPEKTEEGEKKVFRPRGGGTFAAQLKAEKSAKTGGRFLAPDETFGNEANLDDPGEKKEEEADKEKEKKEAEVKRNKILRRNETKPGEENKDNEEKGGEPELKEPKKDTE